MAFEGARPHSRVGELGVAGCLLMALAVFWGANEKARFYQWK